MTSVTIPNTVEEIGAFAFAGCDLSKVTIPNSVEVIGDTAFSHSYSKETEIEFEEGSKLRELGDIFPDTVEDLKMLKGMEYLESIDFGYASVCDITPLKELKNLKKVTGIWSTDTSAEFLEKNVEYKVSALLGEEMDNYLYSDEYLAVSEQGKIPIYVESIQLKSACGLFSEENIAKQAGTEEVKFITDICIRNESGTWEYAEVPGTITVGGWNVDEPLENSKSIELNVYDAWVTRSSFRKAMIKDGNNQLWSITDEEEAGFKIERKAENVKEYVSERLYLWEEDKDKYADEPKIQYLTFDNVLYADDAKVTDKVIKYDKFYALTEVGELKNMQGITVLTNVKDFIAEIHISEREIYVDKYLVLKQDGTLVCFNYNKETELTKIDTGVKKLQQGVYFGSGVFGSYLKENGEYYQCNSDSYELAETQVKDILDFNIIQKTDDSIWFLGNQYVDLKNYTYTEKQFLKKQLFDINDNIENVYSINNREQKLYNYPERLGQIQNFIFVNTDGTVYGFNEQFEKQVLCEQFQTVLVNGFQDINGKKYGYKNGNLTNFSIEPEKKYNYVLKIENGELSVNGVLLMKNVVDADILTDSLGIEEKVIFTRNDGTVWVLDYKNHSAPVKIASFVTEDKETGIGITNEDGTPFTDPVELKADDVTTNEHYTEYAKKAEQLGTSAKLFDISMLCDGVAVQPSGKLKVVIPLPQDILADQAKVYHIAEDGTATDMNAVCEEGKIVFLTDHFSVYAILNENPILLGDADGDGKINMKDNALIKRYLAGWEVTINEKAADMNGDGKVNMKDNALLKRQLAGWEN